MEAKVTQEFSGVEDGKVHPRLFRVGEVIKGELARSMVEAGYASSGTIEDKMLDGVRPKKRGGRTAPGRQSSSGQAAPAKQRKLLTDPPQEIS